ncbi:MAG: hypothetical protein QXX25_03145 [Thermofilaceae archaeon]
MMISVCYAKTFSIPLGSRGEKPCLYGGSITLAVLDKSVGIGFDVEMLWNGEHFEL